MSMSQATSTALALTSLHATETRRSASTCRLPDGRRLAYEEYGCPDGRPLLYFHDAGSSRLEAALFHTQARDRGLRLIAMDRPGVGQSDFTPVSQPVAFCRDVLFLADRLGLSRFAVLSFGSGGIYALALARHFPQRLEAHVSIGGVPGSVFAEMTGNSSVVNCLGGVTPTLIKCLVRMKYRLFPENPAQNIARLGAQLNYTDRKLLQDASFTRRLVLDQQEALRHGYRGVAQDIALSFRKLDFQLQDITVPTAIWLGGADPLTQRADCEFLAARLPRARLFRAANLGHFFFVHRMDQIFTSLVRCGDDQLRPALAA